MFDTEPGPLFSDEELETLTASEHAAWPSHDDGPALPLDTDEWIPGPYLALILSSVNRSTLNGYQLVDLLRAEARQISHSELAGYHPVVADVVRRVASWTSRFGHTYITGGVPP